MIAIGIGNLCCSEISRVLNSVTSKFDEEKYLNEKNAHKKASHRVTLLAGRWEIDKASA